MPCTDHLSGHDLTIRGTIDNKYIVYERMSGKQSSGVSESRVRELSLLESSHQLDDIKEIEDGGQKHSQKKGRYFDARHKENVRSNDGGSIMTGNLYIMFIPGFVRGKNVLKSRKATHLGSSGRSSTTPLPEKGILLAILMRLQKKDIYKVFSVPVDPKKLPDYHGVIKYPMDYGTITRKLDGRAYNNLEEFEVDVFLLCSNAMHYNGKATVYYKQAKTMKALAEKSFAKLRGEPKVKDYQPQLKAHILKANKKRKSTALMDINLTNKKVNANEAPKEQKLEVLEELNTILKDTICAEVCKKLEQVKNSSRSMASALRFLGITVDGWPKPSSEDIHKAYEQALFTYNPDQQSGMPEKAEVTEIFKFVIEYKKKFGLSYHTIP